MLLTPDELQEAGLSLCRIRGWDPEEIIEERTVRPADSSMASVASVAVPFGGMVSPPNPGFVYRAASAVSTTINRTTRLYVAKREIQQYCEIRDAIRTALCGDF